MRPFSPETLADRWACSAEKVRQMCRAGEIASFRLGKLIRIPSTEVERIECQIIDSSDTADSSASLSHALRGDVFASRLERLTEGPQRLALVQSGEPSRSRNQTR